MKKSYLLSLFLILPIILSIPVLAQESDDKLIPSWVKSVAGYWSEDKINDLEFIEALEFLIDNRVINLGDNIVVDMSEQEKQWQDKFDRNMQEQSKVVTEMDEEYNTMIERRQTAEDEKEKHWTDTFSKLSEENDMLKKQIKELEK